MLTGANWIIWWSISRPVPAISISQLHKPSRLQVAVIVTTPQNVALADAKKGIGMFMMNAINVPILGIVENMAWFTPAELPDNKYYIFGQGGGQRLAARLDVPFLGEIPLVKSISDSGDAGRPVVLEEESPMSEYFLQMAKRVAQQVAINNAKAAGDTIVNN